MAIKITICGDTCPINGNQPYFISGDVNNVFHDLFDDLSKTDLSIINLECPLIEGQTPAAKSGPVLGAPSETIKAIVNAKIGLINLANNHILDHGQTGLLNTISKCQNNGLEIVGAGQNLKAARKMFVKKIDEIRIGVLAVAEHEYSIAGETTGGANPLDIIDYVRNLKENKNNYDYLIVLLHGGNEHYPYPSPRLMDTCRFMVEQGANAVICQHSHCVGSYEKYLNGLIVYGQGNFIFDYPVEEKEWHIGLMVKLNISSDLSTQVEFVPFTQSSGHIGAKKMETNDAQVFIKTFEERSENIKNITFVKENWDKYCSKNRNSYISSMLCLNDVLYYMNKNGLITRWLYSHKSLRAMGNMVRCESHHEVLVALADMELKD